MDGVEKKGKRNCQKKKKVNKLPIVAELSQKRVEEMEGPDESGGAAQTLEGEQVRCVPGGDVKPGEAEDVVGMDELGLSLENVEESVDPAEVDDCEIETRKEAIAEIRNSIEENAYKNVIPPSRSVVKMMNRFYRKLEESVWRMSALGCIEEDENCEPDETLSSADMVRMQIG